jgi:gliding motility-associated-like protein
MRLIGVWFVMLFFCGVNDSFAQVNLNSGLVAYFPFSGNTNDASGNNIHGTANNVALTSDQSGQANSAYLFDGLSSYIQLPFSNLYNFAPSGAFSIAVWVQPALDKLSFGGVVVKGPYHTDFVQAKWNYGGYTFNLKAMSGCADKTTGFSTTVFQNSPCWYHIVWSYDNGKWYMYVNGKLESSDLTQQTFILQDGSSKLVMGKKGEAFGDFYKGKMDELRLYNRLLNQAEINALSDPGVHPLATNDTTVCKNSSFQLRVTGATTYQWTPSTGLSADNIPDPMVTVPSTTRYIVTGKSLTGCAANDTVNISVAPVPVVTKTKDTSICYGAGNLQLVVSGGNTYTWSPSATVSNVSIPDPLVSPLVNTLYHVTVGYGPGCTIKDSIQVNISQKLKLSLSPRDTIICAGISVPVAASGALNFTWTPATGLNNAQIASPIASPVVTTRYYVTATDANNCQITDSINITVNPALSQSGYFVPNAFTPNNDRLNDCFGIGKWGALTSLQFDIYNRWGMKVFSATNPSKCWDGRYHSGELAESGRYIYIIKAVSACGLIDRMGSVQLIR